MQKYLRVIVILSIFLLSCNYKFVHQKWPDGQRVWHREYKSDKGEQEERYYGRKFFRKNYSKTNYTKYHGNIPTDTCNGFTWFQFDTIKIYLLNNTYGSEHRDLKTLFSSLFQNGIITPQLIYCATNSCKPVVEGPYKEIRYPDGEVRTSDTIIPNKEFAIKITNFEFIPYLSKGYKRKVFRMEYKLFRGLGYEDRYFLLELTNEQADVNTSLKDFISGSTLTFFKFQFAMGEI